MIRLITTYLIGIVIISNTGGNMKVSKKDIMKWINALRSGEYRQTIASLQDTTGYCCLGVACKLFIPKSKLEYDFYGVISGTLPEGQENAPEWLKNIDREVHEICGYGLSKLNDSYILKEGLQRFNFDEIADVLQAIYIEEVL